MVLYRWYTRTQISEGRWLPWCLCCLPLWCLILMIIFWSLISKLQNVFELIATFGYATLQTLARANNKFFRFTLISRHILWNWNSYVRFLDWVIARSVWETWDAIWRSRILHPGGRHESSIFLITHGLLIRLLWTCLFGWLIQNWSPYLAWVGRH